MNWLVKFWQSTVGKKFIMGISGLIGFGFVFVHMAGNLLVYAGPEALNAYGATLKANKLVLWGARGTLILALVAHVLAAITLQSIKSAARPVGYSRPGNVQARPGSRRMMLLGWALLLFIVYHLLHFTILPAYAFNTADNVYGNVVTGFSNIFVALSYVLAMAALFFHLWHGGQSAFFSLGLIHPKYQQLISKVAYVACMIIVLGNMSIPISVFVGIIKH